MTIIEAFQKAEQGALINGCGMKKINHFLRYERDGTFHEYKFIGSNECKHVHRVRLFSFAEIISTDWEVLDIKWNELKELQND